MDVRQLTGSRPIGQRWRQVVDGIVSFEQPAPATFTDPLHVTLPSHTGERALTFETWPVLHGRTLPTQGTPVVVAYDQDRVPHVVGWEGPNTPWIVTTESGTIDVY